MQVVPLTPQMPNRALSDMPYCLTLPRASDSQGYKNVVSETDQSHESPAHLQAHIKPHNIHKFKGCHAFRCVCFCLSYILRVSVPRLLNFLPRYPECIKSLDLPRLVLMLPESMVGDTLKETFPGPHLATLLLTQHYVTITIPVCL